jgi:UDP-N-acetylglucosamine--N-acetylmuramyl-(pentapeptide) pyrophosphoryl-undecaprenol N-acetylglucosamine transferase
VSTLLVASAGGHFEELRLLRGRLGLEPEDTTWVTWDTAQTRSALGAEKRIYVERCQPKDLTRVLHDGVVARRVLSSRHWDRVISTGSIVAVPFLTVARLYGIACHYIESAARITGPSLSARILERVPGVHCYGQSRSWTAGRRSWQYRGSVFDAFEAEQGTFRDIQKVVVSLGTSRYAFPRLVTAVRAVLPPRAEIVWQIGPTRLEEAGGPTHDLMSQDALSAAMREADLVIAHAGVGTALQALEAGHCPVLIPRAMEHGEHVDDHQFEVAAELAGRGLATVCDPKDLTLDLLSHASARGVTPKLQLPDFVLDEA